MEPPKGAKRRAVVLPPWLPPPAWADWVKYRRSQKGWTDKAAELTIRELTTLRADGHDPTAVIEQSIAKGWRGVFPIRNRTDPATTRVDAVRDLMRELAGDDDPRAGFDFDGTAQEVPNV